MKFITQKSIKVFLVTGLFFAGINAGIDRLRGIEFSIQEFIISGFLFGLFSAIYSWYESQKKESQKENI